MEYIQRLRARIGNELVLIPASAVVLLNAAGEVLLHERNESGEWGLPGGLMDTGETAAESAAREVREETGLEVSGLALFGVFSGPPFEVRYPNGDRTAPVVLGFCSSTFTGSLRRTEESPELGFFAPGALPERMNKDHRRFLEAFLDFQRTGVVALR